MTKMIRRSALVICILAIGAQASAEVELLSQSRTVGGGGTLTYVWFNLFPYPEVIASDGNAISAPDFGLFEEEISIDLTSPYPTLGSLISSTQDSEIQTGHFSIHGNAAVDASCLPSTDYSSYYYTNGSGAWSEFVVLFKVSTPTSFSLVGSLTNTYAGTDPRAPEAEEVYIEQNASLQLDRDGVPYLSFGISNNPFYWPPREIAVSEVGILEPGTYTLTVYARNSFSLYADWTGSGSSSFDIDFFLETPVATDEMAWGQVKAIFR